MSWYYAQGQQQLGPVSEEQFKGLVSDGAVTDATLVWREGMGTWQPYGEVRGGPPAISAPESSAPASSGGVAAEEIATRDYQVGMGSCLRRSWELLKSRFWPIVGATLLVYVVLIAANIIPYLGALLGLVLNGPLLGGLYMYYLKQVREQGADVGDAFGGFGPRFVQLMLTQIVTGILAGLCMVPGALVLVIAVVTAMAGQGRVENVFGVISQAMSGGVAMVGLGLLALGFLIAIYLSVCWVFSLILVADKGMNFWSAMSLSRRVVGRHWFGVFFLLLIAGIISMLGLLGCIIGIIFTLPIFFGAVAYLYQDLFGEMVAREE